MPTHITAKLTDAAALGSSSTGKVFFIIFAALVVVGALGTIFSRNPINAVMSLVLSFFCLAGVYAMLFAHFLAALQVLVYAGAIMVLFIFVVMVLNRDEVEPYSWKGLVVRGPVLALGLGYFGYRLIRLLLEVRPVHAQDPPAEFGSVAQIGMILFTDYLFVFEAVSVLLMIAVVAAVVVARTHKQELAAEAEADGDPEVEADGRPSVSGGHH